MRGSGTNRSAAAALVALCVGLGGVARAEIIEEIVAKVNDDVITKGDLDQAEQEVVADIYQSTTGSDLDARVRDAKGRILRTLIDRKVLYHRATRLYDMDKMGEAILSSFKEYKKIKGDEELRRLLGQDNLTLPEFKRRLVEMYAPDEVIRGEVRNRVAVGDKDVAEYYAARGEEFDVPAEASFREIVLLAAGDAKERRRAEAQAIRDRSAAPGADFGKLASEVSEAGTKSVGGLIGPVKRADVAAAIAESLFTLPVGAVAPLLETPYGFHIVKVESRTEERRRPLEEVREAIRQKMEADQYAAAYAAFMKKLWSEAEIWVSPKYESRLSKSL